MFRGISRQYLPLMVFDYKTTKVVHISRRTVVLSRTKYPYSYMCVIHYLLTTHHSATIDSNVTYFSELLTSDDEHSNVKHVQNLATKDSNV